jgi:very-short-patch-repair endonuclease
LPVTTVARTLYDISATASRQDLKRACHQAAYRDVLDPAQIDSILARHPRQPGTRRLLETMELLTQTGPQITRSEFEDRFLPLVEASGLPAPKVNHRVLGHTVDFLWPEARLVVETDGMHAHLRPTAFEDDRARDAELQAAGYLVLRFTWRQLTERPGWVAAKLRAAYTRGVAQI